ncbi:MAG: MOSC domain-containing protein [Sciscionella sp.]
MGISVTQLAFAPVKGMRLHMPAQLRLTQRGVDGDRAFLVVGTGNELLLTTRTPALLQVEPTWEPAGRVLGLRFPDGSEVYDTPTPGAAATTSMYDGRTIPGRLVDGPLAAALSEHLGRTVRLLQRDPGELGTDDRPVTLMSEASLRALAPELGGAVPDPRRFRMTLTITGVDAWTEHGWTGSEIAVGEAVLRVLDPVPRCVVTTHNPESGSTDARVLHALTRLRGKDDMTFGVWCEVIRPGRVRREDIVTPA